MRGSGAPCTVVRAATAHAGAEVWRLAREVVLHFAHLEAPAREPVERGALVRVKHRVERGDVEEPRAVLAIAHRVLELVLVRRMLTDAVLEELLPLECGVVALVQDVPVRDGQLTLAIHHGAGVRVRLKLLQFLIRFHSESVRVELCQCQAQIASVS